MVEERFDGKQIPAPEFDNDDGHAWPAVVEALANFSAGAADKYSVAGALAGARLLVPIVAILDSAETDDAGHQVEKDSHMATVTIVRPDGLRGLLAFTGSQSMTDWGQECRPLAASAERVAMAALQENADVVILDIAGPNQFIVETPGLLALAEGRIWLPPIDDPEVTAAIHQILANVPGSQNFAFEIQPGSDATDLRVVAHPSAGTAPLSTTDVVEVLKAAAQDMQNNPLLASRVPQGIEFGLLN